MLGTFFLRAESDLKTSKSLLKNLLVGTKILGLNTKLWNRGLRTFNADKYTNGNSVYLFLLQRIQSCCFLFSLKFLGNTWILLIHSILHNLGFSVGEIFFIFCIFRKYVYNTKNIYFYFLFFYFLSSSKQFSLNIHCSRPILIKDFEYVR